MVKQRDLMKLVEYQGEYGHFEDGAWVPRYELVRRSIGDDESYIRDARLKETPGESLGRYFTIYRQILNMEAEGHNTNVR